MTIIVTPITEAEFNSRLYNLLKQLEKSSQVPYSDKVFHPTIGIGFDLTVEPVLKKVFAAMGIATGSATEAALRSAVSNSVGKPTSDVQTNLDKAYGKPFVMTDAQINAAFTEIAKSYIKTAQGSGTPYSNELVALTSVAFNGLYGHGLAAALSLADPYEARAEAWYQIRVVHVGGQNDKRRIAESSLFGLYPPGQTVDEDMARAVYRVFTRHADNMIRYDTQYGGWVGEANQDLLAAGFAGNAANLENSLSPGARVLMDKYGQGMTFSPLNIRVTDAAGGQATASDTGNSNLLIGDKGVDVLTGGNAVDVLVGGDGNDRLRGGKGNDILIGGKGNDTYIWHTGDGSDTIIDEDHQGSILINGGTPQSLSAAGIFIKQEGVNVWKKSLPDGLELTLTHNSPWSLVMADGSTLQLGETQESFQDGDFGINLYEETAAPTQFTRTILGDLQPIDFDLNTAGLQSQTDDLGNLIVNANQPAPGRNDALQDSTGNDLIQGLGGNDNIVSWRGGDDRIEGGDGNDWMLGGLGRDIVIGGAGRDVLVEGGGDDKLYADNIVTLEAAIAAQNATPSGTQGEALSGGSGDDLAIGGIGNDVLLGGTGDDILIAGAGNDDIDGDAMADNIMPDWSTQRSVTATSYNLLYNQFNMDWPTLGGNDVIYAGAGEDWVLGGYGNDYIDGGNDADVLWGEGGYDDIYGGAGNDLIMGDNARLSVAEHGDDYLDGGEGDDTLFGEGGSDMLFGGMGNDKLYADYTDGSGAGYDYLDGEAGNDTLMGGALADELFGGEGNDFLQGDSGTGNNDGDDTLDGEAGDDILLGEGGKDEIYGGDGADQIAGDNGGYDTSGDADTIFGGAGNDIIDGQGGDDVIDAGADNDLVAGGLGNDLIMGGLGNDQLQGGAGDDILEGGDGVDTLFGGIGNDTLRGGDGTDYLLGGRGDDILDGGAGNDVYYYSSGEGSDHISDSGGTDWLVFTDIYVGQITLGTGSLKINLPDGSELHLDDFDPDNPYAAGGIEYFRFADGSIWTKNQLISMLGIQPTGTPEADMLTGTALSESIQALAGDDVVTARAGNDTVYAGDGADMVYGGDGNDILYGGSGDDVLLGENGNDALYGEAGNDLLSGGAGTDILQGGDGDDTYLFQSGDGQDTVTDALGTNAIVLGAGLTLDAIIFTRQGSDLLVTVKNSTDRLTIKDWFAADSHFARITLGDGATLDHAGVEAVIPKNQAPVATQDTATVVEDGTIYVSGNALFNDSDPEGRTLRVTNAGTYAGSAGTLSLGSDGAYSYTLDNSSMAVQSLAAGQSLTETFAYTVTDDDPNGAATASSSICITVQGTNDLPTLGADSATTSEDAAPISGNVLSNDTDIDAGTALTIANPGLRTGTYGSLSLGSDGVWGYSLANASRIVQSLAAGQSVTDNFSFNVSDGLAQVGGSLSIRITGQNDAPILVTPLADQSALANRGWTWQMPAGSFADVDAGDLLAYRATLADGTALPSWLAFDAATQTLSGRVPRLSTGSIDIRIAATDRQGAMAADVFTLRFDAGMGGGGGSSGGGSSSQGNEGVGNGVDAPPPGHDISFNDGAGTSPGNPGAAGGNGYVPPERADILLRDVQVNGRRMAEAAAENVRGSSANAHASAPGQVRQDSTAFANTGVAGSGSLNISNSNGNGQDVTVVDTAAPSSPSAMPTWLQEAAWRYLDTRGSDAGYASTGAGGDTVTAFMQWLAVQQALADQGRNGVPDWLDVRQGADLRGMLLTDSRFLGNRQTFGGDPLGLQAAAPLQSFSGMGNGLQKIA